MANRAARTVNNLTGVITILSLLLGGVLLLVWATSLTEWRQTVVEQAGGTLLVAALLSVAWDFYGRRALAGEVMEAANLSGVVQQFGLTSIGTDFRAIPFARMLEANQIDVYLGLGRSWYSTNSASLQVAAKRPTTKIRVILADPTDDVAVECMAVRFSRPASEVRSNIKTATENFLSLARGAAATIEVYHRSGEPLHSLYRFDGEAVVTLYNHRRNYGDFPYMIVRAGGTFFRFVETEFEDLVRQGVRQQ